MANLAKRLRGLFASPLLPVGPSPVTLSSPLHRARMRAESYDTATFAGRTDAYVRTGSSFCLLPALPDEDKEHSSAHGGSKSKWEQHACVAASEDTDSCYDAHCGLSDSASEVAAVDVGDASASDLAGRYTRLRALCSIEQGSGDGGAASAAELKQRWLNVTIGAQRKRPRPLSFDTRDDAGAQPTAELSTRWAALQQLGRVNADAGAVSQSEIQERWLTAAAAVVDDSTALLQQKWYSLKSNATLGDSVGAARSSELRERWLQQQQQQQQSSLYNSQGIGALSSAELKARWLSVYTLGSSIGPATPDSREQLQSRWTEVTIASKTALNTSVGDAASQQLTERWSKLSSVALASSCDVGAADQQGLAERWTVSAPVC
jgi:hypothetical protein